MNAIKADFVKYFHFWLIVIFAVFFFGRIAYVAVQHQQYIATFKVKCAAKGGVTQIPKGVRGWQAPFCVNPDSIIEVEMNSL